jgi:DNA-binding HxlR family transcriptional regulator
MNDARRSNCPVACTLDLLGDKWTLLVVRDLIVGKRRFDEFLASPEGVASNILADRLARLTAAGLVEQRPNPEHRGRATYHLTPRGASLESVIATVASWGLENLPGTSLAGSPLDPSRRARSGRRVNPKNKATRRRRAGAV